MKRLLATTTGWGIVAAAAIPLILPGPFTPFAFVILVAWLGLWLWRDGARRLPPHTLALVALVVAGVFAGTAEAFDRTFAYPKALGYVLGVSVVLIAAATTSSDIVRRRLGIAIPVLGIGVAGASILGAAWLRTKSPAIDAIVDVLPSISHVVPRSVVAPPGGSGFHPNEIAGTMATFVAVAAAIAVSRGTAADRWIRWLAAGGAALCFAVLVLTQSRGGLVAGAIGIAVAGLARFAPRRVRGGAIVIGAAVLVSAILLATGSTLGSRLFDAVDRASFDSGTGAGRWSLWERASEMARDHWVVGIGLNTFPFVLDTQYPARDAIAPTAGEVRVAHAHNLALQTVLDIGLPAALGLGALAATAVGGWLRRPVTLDDWIADAGVAGLAAYLTFGLADAVALGAKPSILFWLCLGLVLVRPDESGVLDRPTRRLMQIAIWSCAIVATVIVALGVNILGRGDWRATEARTVASALDRLAEPTDLVLVNESEAAGDRILRDIGPSAARAAAPADDAAFGRLIGGYRVVWLVDTVDAVSRSVADPRLAGGGLRSRYRLDTRGRITDIYRVGRALLLRYEIDPVR